MYVISLTCYFCAFDEGMVLSLTILNMRVLDNASSFSFAKANLGSVSGGRRKYDMLWCFALRYSYYGQIFFLIKIGTSKKIWYPTIFESEEGCRLWGSWKINIWWIVMHGNFFSWLEKGPFNYISSRLLIIGGRFIWTESCYFHANEANCFWFQFTKSHINVFSSYVFIFQYLCWFCCWRSCYLCVQYKMLQRNRFYCIDHPVSFTTW